MVNKCSIINCKGNYDDANKCSVYRLPSNETERQEWINKIPPRENFTIKPSSFFICEKHWPSNTPLVTVPGGRKRPRNPPSIFECPSSCLPTPKPSPRQPKEEDRQLKCFLKKDKITSFENFQPDKELHKKYQNIVLSRSRDKFVCIFMTTDFSQCSASVVVHNKPVLCSPLTLTAFKDGFNVQSMGKILNPNNGLSSYSQFFEVVHNVINYNPPVLDVIRKVSDTLEGAGTQDLTDVNIKRLKFFTRQLQLLGDKKFTTSDYCFAMESYPRCRYEQLRDVLVLPSKRKIQSVISSIDVEHVMKKTFEKTTCLQQKNCILLVDEVKIRPTVAFSGGILSGMAKNDPEARASSMLCVMMKCLHGGPSLMVSVTPVHRLTAKYQFSVVKDAASVVEQSGGIVLGSMTDNHKINQQYCKLFKCKSDYEAEHPLDKDRPWFLLYDSVHLLKCIRNNWITEKCEKLSLDKKCTGTFSDIKNLYESEKDSLLKSTPLTVAAVRPSKLQLQNVQHVLHLFNDRVVAALKLRGAHDTAAFMQQVLNWWNVMNVSGKGQDKRMKDPYRAAQEESSTSLEHFVQLFENSDSGQGAKRVECLTHDTKRALVQTMNGLTALCKLLFMKGFRYVLLRELQSDRIEGEFSVYRQSTGANAFMQAGDVYTAFKSRLARFAATYLESLEGVQHDVPPHICRGIDYDEAKIMEVCAMEMTLSGEEENAVAYVAGWLEMKCKEKLSFSEEDAKVGGEVKSFIEEVSKGSLTVPHMSTYDMVRIGACFVKKSTHGVCCRNNLINTLFTINLFYDFGEFSSCFYRRLSNVLLRGLHNLEKDHQKNATLYQTSIKKARLAD